MDALLEGIPAPGATSITSGSSTAQTIMVPPDTHTVFSEPSGYGVETEPEEPQFTDLELKLAKRFLELIGGPERARDLINKCDECQECLGLVGDDDENTITSISQNIPSDVDLPTQNSSSLYNPSASVGPYVA